MQWQPIESAPKDGTLIDLWLVFEDNDSGRAPDCYWSNPANQWQQVGVRGSAVMGTPTHWFLPVPPEA